MTSDNKSRGIAPQPESREEALLDDAIGDTFPASDPVAHGQPGSLINLRYAALERGSPPAQRSGGIAGRLLLMGLACACVVMLVRRRKV